MKVLVVGAGVVGTVYGAQLAVAGHSVTMLARAARADQIARTGLAIHDARVGTRLSPPAAVLTGAAAGVHDLVLIAVRSDQVASAFAAVNTLSGRPTLLCLGNNPAGRSILAPDHVRSVRLGFPGIGGSLVDGTVEYMRISQQPTAIEAGGEPAVATFELALHDREFKTQRVADMSGWLRFHAVFVASVAAALYRCDIDPVRLAADRPTLSLMCAAISEGFDDLRRHDVGGAPRSLAFLHRTPLHPIAVRYWARMLRSPMGELCFAAHARHAEREMRALAADSVARASTDRPLRDLHQLLDP